MRITSIGHAGMLVETAAGRIVCDPWFTPAYFASWFPFPDNSAYGAQADPAGIRDAEYLFVSHLHHDHYDPRWLAENMSKDTTVLLPDYQVPDLRDELEKLGFRNFVQTRNREVTELPGGLRILIDALITPTDGPLGDSGIAIDDGEVRIFNQNDARPVDDGAVAGFASGDNGHSGPYDAHFLQYSGAIWYPMVYDFPERMKATVGRRKRENGMARALRYVDQYDAKQVFPFAGPPCFLDERDGLFAINDFDDDPTNVFPSQLAFLEFMREQGHDNGHLFIPGTTVVLGPDGKCEIEQVPQSQIDEIYGDRRTYLTNYQKRAQPQIEAMHAGLPQDKSDLVGQLKQWVEPLLAWADHTCAGLNGRILLETADPATGEVDDQIVFDFLTRTVGEWDGEAECRYRFRTDRPLIEELVRNRTPDWVNELFLSCRFQASRKGPYNEYIYTFFKSLSEEHMTYVEGYYAESSDVTDLAKAEGYAVQRHCPHLKADLTRFGTVADGVLTCSMHGWQFDLASGRCLTSDDRKLAARPLTAEDGELPEIPTA
ncbi:Rieske 2Fe-2S domain-containing protein [Catenulispora pinisilvae]|uniref:Rieske 2Fe-2S domain-containing protein n=1 Tax=Catenulispora pinisilvae TaxID=2705253 RepID=UPI0018911192|nr:Rieske 2Fe-2S domain-containing protein [Catenulispora pinisilvae]